MGLGRQGALPRALVVALVLVLLLQLSAPVLGGTESNPEVTDAPDDAFDPPGPIVSAPPELEILKAWYTYVDLETFRLTIEVSSFSGWLANSSYGLYWCVDCNASDSNRAYTLEINAGGPLRATCSWTDDPQSGPGNITNVTVDADPSATASPGTPGDIAILVPRECVNAGPDGTLFTKTQIRTSYTLNGTGFPSGQVDSTDAGTARDWTLQEELIAAVALSSPTDLTESSFELAWGRSSDERFDHYEVHVSTDSGFTPSAATLVKSFSSDGATTYKVSGLNADTTYSAKVRVVADDDTFADSNEVSAHTVAPSTEPPTDTDGDGIGDSQDADDDNDAFSDAVETSEGTDPLDPNSTPDDYDHDKDPDSSDPDDDNDGSADQEDAFPHNAAEWQDNDHDSIGDNTDADDDNDGATDKADAFPLDSKEKADLDGDGLGDNTDPDDDNDGVSDGTDAFPADRAESTDTDRDGTGDNADTDDDSDGFTSLEALPQQYPGQGLGTIGQAAVRASAAALTNGWMFWQAVGPIGK